MTSEQFEALQNTILTAVETQQEFVSEGDHDEDWPEVAAEKAKQFRLVGEFLTENGAAWGGLIDQIEDLVKDLEAQ